MGQRYILVADDEPNIRKLAKLNLERQGYTVLTAKSGAEAWNLLQTEMVDAGVFDMAMPEGNGVQLVTWMRQDDRLKQVPVLLMGGLSGKGIDSLSENSAIQSDPYTRILQPFNLQQCFDEIKRFFTKRKQSVR